MVAHVWYFVFQYVCKLLVRVVVHVQVSLSILIGRKFFDKNSSCKKIVDFYRHSLKFLWGPYTLPNNCVYTERGKTG